MLGLQTCPPYFLSFDGYSHCSYPLAVTSFYQFVNLARIRQHGCSRFWFILLNIKCVSCSCSVACNNLSFMLTAGFCVVRILLCEACCLKVVKNLPPCPFHAPPTSAFSDAHPSSMRLDYTKRCPLFCFPFFLSALLLW